MKTNKFLFSAMLFLGGLGSGISLIALLSFANAPATPAADGGIVQITSDVARTYVSKYLSDAAPFNQVIKGFTVDRSQLDAMNAIAKENPALVGFRIYMGLDNSSKKSGIVVGIDNTGKDAVRNSIYQTDTQSLSPCPPVCDVSSPIIGDN